MWIIAESTFGAGWKLFAEIFFINVAWPKSAVWRERIVIFGSRVVLFSATSFWTRRVSVVGGFLAWRK